ncbi:hypothetical protein NL676_021551 [Syzygium grande]|nr:hypothetical protein NL676_021551 [Syzygium grande]
MATTRVTEPVSPSAEDAGDTAESDALSGDGAVDGSELGLIPSGTTEGPIPNIPASFIVGLTSELDPSGIVLPLFENIASSRKALLEATSTHSTTSFGCNEDLSSLSAKEKCQEFLKLSEGGLTAIISDPPPRDKGPDPSQYSV